MQIKVGQQWKTYSGHLITIHSHDEATSRWIGSTSNEARYHYDENGRCTVDGWTGMDLEKLVADFTELDDADADSLASETLQALGWTFDGQCWVEPTQGKEPEMAVNSEVANHPLFPVLVEAIEQAMYGKGGRHGGNTTPFLKQPWVHYVKMHGRGFATGQAAKKLEEAASTRTDLAFDTEVLGSIVYAGMSILKNRGVV